MLNRCWIAAAGLCLLLSARGGGGTPLEPEPVLFGAKQWGTAGVTTYGLSAANDASGNVYVAGYTSGGLDGNTLTGLDDAFLVKYDVSGNRR